MTFRMKIHKKALFCMTMTFHRTSVVYYVVVDIAFVVVAIVLILIVSIIVHQFLIEIAFGLQ